MTDPHDQPDTLTPAGAARRDAMLAALRAEVPRAAAARRARRRAVRTAFVMTLVGVAALLALPRRVTPPATPIAQAPAPGWSVVQTDTSAAARLTVHSRADWSGVIVGDDELLLELEEMGRPAGLIRTGGKAWISGLELDHSGS